MNKKYVGKALMLPHDAAAALIRARAHLKTRLGFEPSLSQTVAFLCEHYERTVPLDERPVEKDTVADGTTA